MRVSETGGARPQLIHFNRISHYKPSILEYPPNLWKPQIIDPAVLGYEVTGGPDRKGSQGQQFGTI